MEQASIAPEGVAQRTLGSRQGGTQHLSLLQQDKLLKFHNPASACPMLKWSSPNLINKNTEKKRSLGTEKKKPSHRRRGSDLFLFPACLRDKSSQGQRRWDLNTGRHSDDLNLYSDLSFSA